jgi:hypothetical protein
MSGAENAGPVRVGVTGHRFLAEVGKLRAALERALDMIAAAFPGRALVAVSPLAEGADRLVAHAVLDRGGALQVVLPLPVEDYATDFAGEQSQAEFRRLLGEADEVMVLPPTDTRDEAYEQVGRRVLDASEVLIALYDGRPAQGRGGTAQIVEEALARGMPVLHIKAGNRRPGTTEPTTLGAEQGELVAHNL